MKDGITLGVVGLGRMGFAIADRARKGGYRVYGYDTDASTCSAAHTAGIHAVDQLQQLIEQSSVIWIMVPQGAPVDLVINDSIPHLKQNTIIVDGGNSFYKDSQRRAGLLASQGFHFLDCGVSGGLQGHAEGFCLMVGGNKEAFDHIQQLLSVIAAPHGCAYIGPSGTGHYVKMIHNGIEYGILQAIAEGLHVIKSGAFADLHIDLAKLTNLWNHGSVIRSWLLKLTHEALKKDQGFEGISGRIDEGGTGRWVAQEAEQYKIPVPGLDAALRVRAESQKRGGDWSTKLIALIRHEFGGHVVHHEDTRADL